MIETNMRAKLLLMPIKINEIFFSIADFRVHPLKEGEKFELEMKDMEFSSSVKVLDECDKRVQVSVRFRTKQDISCAVEFEMSCVGLYEWEGENLGEAEIKNIYAWGVSIQTSAIRSRLSDEFSRSPYHEVWYLPLSLVKVEATGQK